MLNMMLKYCVYPFNLTFWECNILQVYSGSMAVCLYHWSVNTSYLWVQRCCARSQYPAVYGRLGFSAYRWPEQQSQRDVTFIYVYATSDMPRRPENVLYYCACKQQSFHAFGTGCLRAAAHSASQHAFTTARFHLQLCLAKDNITRSNKL